MEKRSDGGVDVRDEKVCGAQEILYHEFPVLAVAEIELERKEGLHHGAEGTNQRKRVCG